MTVVEIPWPGHSESIGDAKNGYECGEAFCESCGCCMHCFDDCCSVNGKGRGCWTTHISCPHGYWFADDAKPGPETCPDLKATDALSGVSETHRTTEPVDGPVKE